MVRRVPIVLLWACAFSVAAVPPAPAATGLGGVSVSPASIDVRAQAGDALPAVRVGNDTGRPVDVRIRVVPADQELSGLPVFSLDAASLAAGRRLVRASPERFTVPAGSGRAVELRVVGREPLRRGGSYGVVVAEAVPTVDPGAADPPGGEGLVDARLRLTANLLLAYPGHGPRRAEAVALRAEQGPQRTLAFAVRVRGTGDIHVRPKVRLRVRDEAGRLVARGRVTSGNVLPDAQRELPAVVREVLPAGRYTARAVVEAGGRRTFADHAFTLVGPGELPSADLAIVGLRAPEGAAGEDTSATVEIVNRGTAPAPAHGEVVLAHSGGRVLARREIATGPVAPGTRRAVTVDLPGVSAAEHRVGARLLDGDRELSARTIVFTPREPTGAWTRFLDWAGANVPLLLGGFAGILVLVLTGVAAYVRRLQRALAARVPPGATGEPAAPRR
jgi:hypothetical protein